MEKNRIDVVVNNAGYGFRGALEETSIDEIKAQFETNFFGAIRVMQAVIPMMRKQRRGKIVNITSVGGRIPFPLNSLYNATKFALEGLSEAVMADTPDFRYVVGKDAAMMLETGRNISDREFQDLIRQQFNLQNIS